MTWPVVVVGAGPAGALAAYLLARAGVEVLLVDKATFPRWKVCGCCLNPRAVATLRRTGLGELLAQQGAIPLAQLHWASGHRSALIPLPPGVALSRQRFDLALIEAAQAAGVAFRSGTRAQSLSANPMERRLLLQNETGTEEIATRVLLAADGLGGQLLAHEPIARPHIQARSRIGAGALAEFADPFFAPGVIYMTSGTGGYVGLVRLEDGTLDLAAALDPVLVKRVHVAETVRRILAQSGWPVWPDPASLNWHGTPALTRHPGCVAGARLFLLGDAAGYVEPFTGEGMGWALASAVAVVPFVLEALQAWRPDVAVAWQHQHAQLFGAARRRCRLVTTLLRAPWLTTLLVRVLRHFPRLAQPWIPSQGVA